MKMRSYKTRQLRVVRWYSKLSLGLSTCFHMEYQCIYGYSMDTSWIFMGYEICYNRYLWTCVCVWGEWVVLPQPAKPSLAELQFLGETEQGTGSILWLQSMKCSRLLGPGQCSDQLLRPNVCPTGKVRECHRTHHRLLELVKRHALTKIKTIANIHRSPHWKSSTQLCHDLRLGNNNEVRVLVV